jgi:hypothetical protein
VLSISTDNIDLDLGNSDVPNDQSVSKCYQSRLITLTSTLIILMFRMIKVSVSVINLDWYNIDLDLDNSDVPNDQSVSKCYHSRLV